MKTKSKRNPHIAILDPDPAILKYLHRILADHFTVSTFTEAAELVQGLKEPQATDLLLMDWHIAEDGDAGNSLGLLTELRASKPALPIILLACSAELRDVVMATRMGATDVILKPFRKADIDRAVHECIKENGKRPAEDGDEAKEIPLDENTSFVIASKRMREIESQCRLVARADIPVLILGESGTGKEVATLFIHKMSARSQRSFMKVNCAAMPADLLESELFGYEPGAFTGAIKSKPGKFEICNNGTIFLDEIGEMPAALQAKLLQVLQDGSFSRLGSQSSVKVDVRVIAATNIDIKDAIARKTFREDLYYRLNGFTLKMPPLRERPEEIPILTYHFMQKVAAKYERDALPISPVLMQALSAHAWPGNLRELENTVKRYLILADEQAIIDELNPRPMTDSAAYGGEENGDNGSLKHLVRNLKGGAESAAIARTLEGTGWNRKAAASDLQISYKALLYKIKQYNLVPPKRQFTPSQAQKA
ncbi:MAG: sigma-54 dependent transcriptional regulator [Terracidiphilus sp.]|jgi:DNA-binding NtrC family response regulator